MLFCSSLDKRKKKQKKIDQSLNIGGKIIER